MKLTNKTFKNMIQALQKNYLNWELPDESVTAWKNVLALSISDELLPMVILDWITTVTAPPKNPAEIIKHAGKMIADKWDNADTSADIIIDSARNAYYATDDFLTFADDYSNSFASVFGTPAQEAYIKNNINKRSTSPKVLILVYDECKGAVKDCFKGDAEHGVDFLRNQIKKSWNAKLADDIKKFLISDDNDIKRLLGGAYGSLEA